QITQVVVCLPRRYFGWRITTHMRRPHGKSRLRQRFDLVAPGIGIFRKAVQQNNRRPRPCHTHVQAQVATLDLYVFYSVMSHAFSPGEQAGKACATAETSTGSRKKIIFMEEF